MRQADLDTLRGIMRRRGGFGHREHLELAWNHLGNHDPEAAYRAVVEAIRHVAELHDAPEKYHETITRFWIHLVAVHRSSSDARTFDEFVAENPGLLDRHLLERHYSREHISSGQARAGWVEPDLRPLPLTA